MRSNLKVHFFSDMGQGQSQPAAGFSAVWEALPEAAQAAISALAEKESVALTQPHPSAPEPFPAVPVSRCARMSTQASLRRGR